LKFEIIVNNGRNTGRRIRVCYLTPTISTLLLTTALNYIVFALFVNKIIAFRGSGGKKPSCLKPAGKQENIANSILLFEKDAKALWKENNAEAY
jgi:hypothetical protein